MLVGKSWKVESDVLNVTLYRRIMSKKTGEERWHAEGFYSTVAHALKGMVNMQIKETGLKELKIVVEKIDELHSLIDTTLSTMSKETPAIIKEE